MNPIETLKQLVHQRTYAPTLPSGQKESRAKTIDRCANMHIQKFPEIESVIKEAFTEVHAGRVVPSMRSLQFGGDAIHRANARIYNCAFANLTKWEDFADLFYLLMCGTGTGYSVQKRHVEQLPVIDYEKGIGDIFVVEDNKEGWADTLLTILKHPATEIDVHKVRRKGVPLSTGGTASGPEALLKTIAEIKAILRRANGRKIRPLEAHDIMCHVANGVVVGGVRRAALISLFDCDDKEMLAAKHGMWWDYAPQRARANNSALIFRDENVEKNIRNVMQHMYGSGAGEPGIALTNNLDMGCNPCQPEWAELVTPTGIKKLKDINIGDEVWSGKQWTKVVNKWSTGIKDVYKYTTSNGRFYGTENHKVFECGERVQVKDAKAIDGCQAPYRKFNEWNPQDVMDGLVFGDGTVHKASNNKILLLIGNKDTDYFTSEVGHLITKHRPGITSNAHEILTTITAKELPYTYERIIPDRYYYATFEKKAGFLRGLFSANGCVTAERVQFKTSSKKQAEQIQDMLSSMGMKSSLVVNKPATIKHHNGIYTSRKNYNIILYNSSKQFMDTIGFLQKYKMEKYVKNINEKYVHSKVKDVEYVSTEEVFDITVEADEHSYWTSGLLVSNCAEIALNDGQLCNLTEVNVAECDDVEQFLNSIKQATVIGTLQASYTDFTYLQPKWKETCEREALLGVSLTGQAQKWKELETWLKDARVKEVVQSTNQKIAKAIGIQPSARITTTKPSGTTSAWLGTTSGIHAAHSKYYIRRVRVDVNDPIAKLVKDCAFVEPDIFNPENLVISIPVASPDAITRSEESAIDLMNRAKYIHSHWISAGHIYGDNTHNVSLTVSYHPEEKEEIVNWLVENNKSWMGISFLPYDGGTYRQAPFEEISEDAYNLLVKAFDIPELDNANYINIIDERIGELACAGGACEYK